MKKYFSIIALVLMAALLVVSCSAEKKDDLVNVSIAATGMNGKAVTVEDAVATVYKFQLECKYSNGETPYSEYALTNKKTAEIVIGQTTTPTAAANDDLYATANANFSKTGKFSLGYLSQGLWTLTVNGYAADGTTLITEGSQSIYVRSDASTFSIALQPKEDDTGSFVVDLTLQAIEKTGTKGTIRYTLKAKGENTVAREAVTLANVAADGDTPARNEIVPSTQITVGEEKWFADVDLDKTETGIPAGVYDLTIELLDTTTPDTPAVLGTIKTSVVISSAKAAKISGAISPTDFYLVDGNTVTGLSLAGTLTSDYTAAYSASDETEADRTVTLTWTTTSGAASSVDFFANGKRISTVTTFTNNGTTATTTYTQEKPGYVYFSAVASNDTTKAQGGAVLTDADGAGVTVVYGK